MAWIRARYRRSEEGFTLIELLCAMFLFALVLTIISGATISMLHSLRKQQGQSDNLDSSRKALELLDQQVRFANAVSQPGRNSAGTASYIEFQNGNTSSGATQTCYQWRLDSTTKQLQYRTWVVPTATGVAVTTASAWIPQVFGAVAIGSMPVFATTAKPVVAASASPTASVSPTASSSANTLVSNHAAVTVTFADVHGAPPTSTQNQVTLTAVNTSGLTTAAAVCAPASINGGVDRP